ncbi:MAG TPA: sigma 54-interacting transcriptional regulator [Terracidiphilus sp.]|nr:sigma 54-interacting transcriptional regulator [Terracidiphilus sp.]
MEYPDSTATIEQDYIECRSEQIIGRSPNLLSALAEVERVAPTNATVLVLGETGTGKELIARGIHDLSPRRERPFVKLDCAAIPFDLLESELFGQEKGVSAGTIAQKIGSFEMADTGTLFLDEIGDLPLALQPKLLRILREQEFVRPGSGRMHRVNVRLVAATHRDLSDMVGQREFRSDLYYRLNGFPILLPPLRERPEDIPLLVSHFVEIFSQRMGKPIHRIPNETLNIFTSHSWPGNVRELQHLIERAVILSSDGVLPNPLPLFNRNSMKAGSSPGTFKNSRQAAIRSNSGVRSDSLPISHDHSVTAVQMNNHGAGSSNKSAEPPIVFVIDGDASSRQSIEGLILSAGWQSETFASAREFLGRPRSSVPNCLVLGMSLQDLKGLDLQKQIASDRAETPIIFIAGEGDVSTSVQAMKAGAVEFLIRPFSDEVFLGAVRESLQRSYVALSREAEMQPIRDRYVSLTYRERQVMALVATGLLNKQVGAELGISEITVKAHRGRVMQKMGANSVVDLARMAARLRSERFPHINLMQVAVSGRAEPVPKRLRC